MKMIADNVRGATARAARTGKRVEVSDDDQRGLKLGISPSGAQRWSLQLRDQQDGSAGSRRDGCRQ